LDRCVSSCPPLLVGRLGIEPSEHESQCFTDTVASQRSTRNEKSRLGSSPGGLALRCVFAKLPYMV